MATHAPTAGRTVRSIVCGLSPTPRRTNPASDAGTPHSTNHWTKMSSGFVKVM